jgi:hypothetical protein
MNFNKELVDILIIENKIKVITIAIKRVNSSQRES